MSQTLTSFFSQFPVSAFTSPRSWGGVRKEHFSSTLVDKIERTTGFKKQDWVLAEQVHGTEVAVITEKEGHKRPLRGVDGIVTNRQDILLVIKHADCVPIFLFDRVKEIIGLVHSGWRGTVGKIGLVALQRMMREFGSRVQDIEIALGPAAQACCYRKPKDSLFTQLPEWKEHIQGKKQELAIDLSGFISQMFVKAGVEKRKITDCRICTVHSRDFWSWTRQRDQKEARGMGISVLGLKVISGKEKVKTKS